MVEDQSHPTDLHSRLKDWLSKNGNTAPQTNGDIAGNIADDDAFLPSPFVLTRRDIKRCLPFGFSDLDKEYYRRRVHGKRLIATGEACAPTPKSVQFIKDTPQRRMIFSAVWFFTHHVIILSATIKSFLVITS